MSSIFSTLFYQHDLWLVALAALVCSVSSFAGIALVDRARHLPGPRRAVWIFVAALAVGFGIWSTHFIAMLAYMPGFAIGYQPLGTLASLLIAIVVSGIGFAMAAYGAGSSDRLLGGIVVGIGITAMHYTGMGALEVGGSIRWDMALVNLSLLFAAGLAAAAVMIGVNSSSLKVRIGASALLTGSIVSLHFTGMGAADLSNCFAVIDNGALSTGWMAIGTALGSSVILGSALLALLLDSRDARRRALESLRLHSLADAAAEGLVIVRDNRIDGANSSFAALVGLEREALLGRLVGDYIDCDAIAHARAADGQFYATVLKAATGESIGIELVSRYAELEKGQTEVLAIRDIRERLAQEAENERARAETRQSEMRYGMLVQSITDYAIYMLDPDGLVASWNAGAQRNKGYRADEIIGESFAKFFSADDQAAGLPEQALRTARREGKFQTEGWRYRKNGSRFWAQVMIEAIRGDDGNLVGFVKITRDITRQHEDAERIAAGSRNLGLSLAHMSQGLALFGADERIVVANRRLNEILDIPDHISIEGLGLHDLAKFLTIGDNTDPESIDAVYATHKRLIAGEHDGEITQEFSGNRSIRIVHRPAGDGAFVSTFEDISERKQSEQKIHYMAHHDGLTGLPNRGSFSNHLQSALDRVGKGARVAVLAIDLDRFKEVNDQLGHQTGDAVLKLYAERISHGLQDGEFVSRFGGDEFAAFKTFRTDAELFAFIERLESAVAERYDIDRNEVSIGASIGVAVYPDDAHTAEKLISNADMAMYRAKPNLTEHVCFYESEMDEAARDRRLMARELWDAIDKDQLSLNYQVQKSVQSGEITGYEALLRWDHPTRGRVGPDVFIEVAEECGAILPIGEWVLRQACREAATWDAGIKLAVNISPVQLGSANLIDVVRRVLESTNLPPDRLELEVTESAIIADKARALHMLQQIKQLGVTIAIDDFGTGYSSLETLRAFPFDKIKLDRSFMSEVETSRQAKAVVRAILELGRGLDVPVLAEGVETIEQLDFLMLEGCDEAQGYYLGRPQFMQPLPEQKVS
ncbi:PAS domain S-box-containing protein/diguanylate cyclase (GGDEF) domain-containing protein [Devosia sp. YR412]|uniref:bifunctional diguanylate cyclase/phosphodiesterase n=1 Tax=Devosia sp. YR412 TaxID=1881030 RepID=UPI0008C5834C|nr:EAL domain-containing protein [Devosia sp. YR412]SEP64627.1 PAS domain S-box-containing protein/diguanylate cyclase (GGDEF) domain-containing protein [Devosia sp. YR412]